MMIVFIGHKEVFMKKRKFKIILLICLCLCFAINYFNATREVTILKTDKKIGDKISLIIEADRFDEHTIWIDLNNNGKKDAGEKVKHFGIFISGMLYDLSDSYIIKSKTITIHGKIRGLYCSENELVSLDVSKAKSLESIECAHNKLTELDVSKCKKLYSLYCYCNTIKQEAMRNLITSLPRHKGKGKGEFVMQCLDTDKYHIPEGNEYISDSIKNAKDKNWRVWIAKNIHSTRWRRGSTEL